MCGVGGAPAAQAGIQRSKKKLKPSSAATYFNPCAGPLLAPKMTMRSECPEPKWEKEIKYIVEWRIKTCAKLPCPVICVSSSEIFAYYNKKKF